MFVKKSEDSISQILSFLKEKGTTKGSEANRKQTEPNHQKPRYLNRDSE